MRTAATAAGAAPAASNGALMKVIDVELQKEAEQSYLAVRLSQQVHEGSLGVTPLSIQAASS